MCLVAPFLASPLTAQNYHSPEDAPKRESAGRPEGDTPTISLNLSITLCDGRTAEGSVELKTEDTLTIRHSKDGIAYTKRVGFSELRSISLKRWKGQSVRESKDGTIFRFDPAEYLIELRDKSTLHIADEIFPFLKEFSLKNGNGLVQLYTYWIDLQKKDGTWYTGMEGPGNGKRITCHSDVVKKIDFLTR
jgi:hypothetical protein